MKYAYAIVIGSGLAVVAEALTGPGAWVIGAVLAAGVAFLALMRSW